jgi:glycosidase
MFKKFIVPVLVIVVFLLVPEGCHFAAKQNHSATRGLHSEVIYHIFERSFYDSNGDLNGDFNGIREKLGYLQKLGVTTLLLTPVVQSVYYHNYFADDFEKIDPAYGTKEDWTNLVKAVHRHGMKIYLDVEFQYVTGRQKWFKDSYENPRSPYSKYILYNGPGNTKPEPIIYNISNLPGYNDSTRRVATVNLYNPGVQDFFYRLLKHWMDPNGDGHFEDGVDGFRLDHMMDNLDHKNILPHLFSRFWCPLITKLKAVNPKLTIIAEQANWLSFGREYFDSGCVDRVFAFDLRYAIASFDKAKISAMADSTFSLTPPAKKQIVFIENHDMERFASAVDRNPAKLRVGAAFNLLIGGIPSIYYGQELGMFGKGGFGRFGKTDGNDIPQREAFEWFRADSGRGMALWYKNTGPWWDSTNLKPDDGVSLEEEQHETGSLWNFYRTLIHLHTSNAALTDGEYAEIANGNNVVFSFVRYTADSAALVVINLSGRGQKADLDMNAGPVKDSWQNEWVTLFGQARHAWHGGKLSLLLPAYGIAVWEIR